jgi:hypothetical protein
MIENNINKPNKNFFQFDRMTLKLISELHPCEAQLVETGITEAYHHEGRLTHTIFGMG